LVPQNGFGSALTVSVLDRSIQPSIMSKNKSYNLRDRGFNLTSGLG